MAVKITPKVNKGIRFERDTWMRFSLQALELGQNRSRLLNELVKRWLQDQKKKPGDIS